MSEAEQERPKNRKRKKSFITLAKKGKLDQGTSIPREDYEYFLSILKEVNSAGDEEIVMLANNVLEQIKGKETDFIKNQLASRVIDNILPYASPENLENIATTISNDYRQFIDDIFGSFILQSLLKTCLHRTLGQLTSVDNVSKQYAYNVKETFTSKHVSFCDGFLVKTSKFLLNNMEEYVADSYGNFIIRTSLCCLVGLDSIAQKPQTTNAGSTFNQEGSSLVKVCESTPEAWREVFFDYVNRLTNWPTFKDFPYEPQTSGLMQIIVKCLDAADAKKQIKSFCKPFFSVPTEPTETQHEIFSCQPSLHFLEAVLAVAGPKLGLSIHQNLFVGHLKALSCDKTTNFSVQRLLEHCQDKAVFESAFDEIIIAFEEVLCCGNTGVVVELAKGCNRLVAKQGQFVQALQKALHCTNENSHKLMHPLLKLTPLDVLEKEETTSKFVHPHGSMILQQMLYFNKPIKLIQNMMEMKKEELVQVFCDKKGSFIADAFCASKFVGEKSRDKLIKHLTDHYLELAVSQFGSRTLEQFYNVGNIGHKTLIVDELSRKLNQLNSTKFGRIINSKLCVFAFARGEQVWKAALNSGSKTETLFKDLVPDKD